MELKNKHWNFTFKTYGCHCASVFNETGKFHNFDECQNKKTDWGWNSVIAKTKKTAVKEALLMCQKFDQDWYNEKVTLDVNSVNCKENTEKALLSLFY